MTRSYREPRALRQIALTARALHVADDVIAAGSQWDDVVKLRRVWLPCAT
jgi:hypothetical protein